MTFAAEADRPYFCGNAAMTPSPVEQAICADERLQVLYAALEFELEDAMTQAVGADKLIVLERIKSEHAAWEESLRRQCRDHPSTLASCVRSAYENRRRELAALLRASGLRPMNAAHAQAPEPVDRMEERAPKPRVSPPVTTAPLDTQASALIQDDIPEPAAPVKPSAAKGGATSWPSVIVGFAILLFAAWWLRRRLRGTMNVQRAALEAERSARTEAEASQQSGGTSPAPAPKKKWRWSWGAAILVVVYLASKQEDLERAPNARASIANTHTNAFPSGTWQCGFLGQIEFQRDGQFIAYNQATDPQSDNALERVAFRTTGTYSIESEVLRLNATRTVAVNGSPQDLNALGRLRDIKMDGVRKYSIKSDGQDVVLVETFKSSNGKMRPLTQGSFVCTAARPAQSALETPEANIHARPSNVAPAPQPVALSRAQGEQMAAMQMIQKVRLQPNPICAAFAQQMEQIWGFYQSGQAHFKDAFYEVALRAEDGGC